MTVATLAKPRIQQMVKILENILAHRHKNPTYASEELYYELMVKYYRRIMEAVEQERTIVGHTVMSPLEVFYGMGIVPMHLESTSMMMAILLGNYAEFFDAARSFGLTPETCSAHRLLAATVIQNSLPRPDFIVWTNQVCDNTSKSGDAILDLYEIPGIFLDRPYRYTTREVEYFTKELKRLVQFLEEQTGQKMDYDRLSEAVARSQRVTELYREIAELRRNIPAPARNRCFLNSMVVEWLYAGTQEAVEYFELVRDEIKERVDKGVGGIPEERFRILTLFLPPSYEWKLMDWMEQEYGAVSVMEPYCSWWAKGDMDPAKPLESIAEKSFYRSLVRQMHGPSEGIIEDAVQAAIDYKADGSIYFAHIGCRQACALIRSMKDALKDDVGIPMIALDCDIIDPSLSPGEEMRGKLEGFFEMLEDTK
ncbi:MAG: hypothetical protein A3G93_04440 [Nitrospinae bacterium RIFCSPLOWO2_12_FULL_45_22]|nr:MAG: hypothetical protein A3G93_04440 [Nitrospinae bacterium RIFCSPLOWO2_12_FULL_45_22]